MQKKLHEMKVFYESDKQEIKRQHARLNENILEETNQVQISLIKPSLFLTTFL